MPPSQTNSGCPVPGKIAPLRLAFLLLPGLLAACGPDYSPNTYSAAAVQKANKVDQGVIVGVRTITIAADSTIGTATGGAAGGIAGSQVGGGSTGGALGALGGSVAGGLVGNMVSHTTGDTTGHEYIVRKPNGDLLSVTQKDTDPLKLGQRVLIIEGPQARIVPDYTVPLEEVKHPVDSIPPQATAGASAEPETAAAAAGAPATLTQPPAAETAAPPTAQAEKTDALPAGNPEATPISPPATESPPPDSLAAAPDGEPAKPREEHQ